MMAISGKLKNCSEVLDHEKRWITYAEQLKHARF